MKNVESPQANNFSGREKYQKSILMILGQLLSRDKVPDIFFLLWKLQLLFENLWKCMDFHENECILMDFLVRTLWRKIPAADTLTAGQLAPVGGYLAEFHSAPGQAYFGCPWGLQAGRILFDHFVKKCRKKTGPSIWFIMLRKRSKFRIYFRTLFQTTRGHPGLKPVRGLPHEIRSGNS